MARRSSAFEPATILPAELSDLYADPQAEVVLTRVYRAILADPAPSRERLVEAGLAPGSLDATLRVLVRHRLIDMAIDGQIAPVHPDAAIPAFAARIGRHAESLLSSAGELSRLYRQARERPGQFGTDQVRLLYTLDEVGQAVGEITGRGRERLLAMRAPTQRIIAVASSPPDVIARPISNAHGVVLRARVVYDTRLLDIPDAISRLAMRAPAEEQRVCPDLPFTTTVVDDDQAVIDLTLAGQVGPVGVVLTSAPLVRPILAVLERLWEFASPLPRASTTSGLDPRDGHVLGMLASGASDATIARQLGVSQRTVERRIRSIMDTLGAESRFQAGLLAKQAGWL
ncbi:MAG: LuxR C-terminal-related transcriptional regulator [Dermatophilaceae bacterium]